MLATKRGQVSRLRPHVCVPGCRESEYHRRRLGDAGSGSDAGTPARARRTSGTGLPPLHPPQPQPASVGRGGSATHAPITMRRILTPRGEGAGGAIT